MKTESSKSTGAMPGHAAALTRNLELALWTVVAASVVVGLFGYGFFTLRPDNLARWPAVAGWHASAMIVGAQIQSMACVGLMLVRASILWGWSLAFRLCAGLSLIGFLAEWVGTSTGIPFGSYHYTDMLGYKIDGLVPWVIPPSWFAMGIPSYALAAAAVERVKGLGAQPRLAAWLRVALGGWLMMTWDLVLDPAMSHLLPYWQWHVDGFFYASPFVNFVGWFGVGSLIMAVLEWGLGSRLRPDLSPRWACSFYGLNVSMSAGMCLLAGEVLPPAVFLASLLAAGSALLLLSAIQWRRGPVGLFATDRRLGHGHDEDSAGSAAPDGVGRSTGCTQSNKEAWQ